MAGGTHCDHSNVEALFGMTFTATGKPFTDAQVDAMCVAAELILNLYLSQYGKSLPTAANTQWRQVVALTVLNIMNLGDKWDKAGGSESTASEMGTAQYARYGAKVLTPELIRLIEAKIADTEGGISYGDSVSTS
jgi:hypothetical protein